MKNTLHTLTAAVLDQQYSPEELQTLFELRLLDDDDNWPLFCKMQQEDRDYDEAMWSYLQTNASSDLS